MEKYKVEFQETLVKDSVKLSTFREAATRLKMLLDDSDFDAGNFRSKRRQAIIDINNSLSVISGL